jgi:hypothetical protein
MARTREEIRQWLESTLTVPTVKLAQFTLNGEIFLEQKTFYFEEHIYTIFKSETDNTFVWWIFPRNGSYDLEAMSVNRFSSYEDVLNYAVEQFFILSNSE